LSALTTRWALEVHPQFVHADWLGRWIQCRRAGGDDLPGFAAQASRAAKSLAEPVDVPPAGVRNC
jgi:hypothetical protein